MATIHELLEKYGTEGISLMINGLAMTHDNQAVRDYYKRLAQEIQLALENFEKESQK